jgi:hypothetical protein
MRQISIFELVPNPTTPNEPQHIIVDGDLSQAFHGSFWKNAAGTVFPFYTYNLTTNLPPYGTNLVPATTFYVKNNSDFDGQYTVYTKLASDSAYEPAVYNSTTNKTKIYVSSLMPQGTTVNVGVIQGISTYKFNIVGGSPLYVEEREINEDYPVAIVGRFSEVWGEVLQQNLLLLSQNFAGTVAPVNPILGQSWFDTQSAQLKIWTGGNWVAITSSVASYNHTQTTAAATWTVTHNLGTSAPFIADVKVYVNTSNGVKMMMPSDISFINANTITISFTSNYSGYATVRK